MNINLEIKKIITDLVNKDREDKIDIKSIDENEEISKSTIIQMDSIKAIKLIVEVEKKFNITVPDDDLDLNNFKSVDSISNYVITRMKIENVKEK
ncbi:Phosphopantetheine attachment site [Anaerosporobacter mobilis DSM 15930]|jgi:acyl carrier protein|uniref:Phosphopantetheine attachment site n=1 Tax=Anaerosporobacter mobilis DSM 15930 TaxID=1120996 RepID=A0A1M7I8Q0_9FIRM|nr:phosphopantetheine-binding protein [Anaerosporobacter mobilis]SHM37075.1 Phosphopantetheine attachment site [Anaerosporobacter mobilis DSM 15930]